MIYFDYVVIYFLIFVVLVVYVEVVVLLGNLVSVYVVG